MCAHLDNALWSPTNEYMGFNESKCKCTQQKGNDGMRPKSRDRIWGCRASKHLGACWDLGALVQLD